jgi:hypothetical protein
MRAAPPLVIALFLFAASAQAQITPVVLITAVPPSPTAGAPFIVHLVVGACGAESVSNVTLNGTNLDIVLTPRSGGCVTVFPPELYDRVAGPLGAGTYTIRVLRNSDNFVIASAPVVVGADVPALDPRVLSLLALALIVLAMIRLAR